jgi:hypothetical protein
VRVTKDYAFDLITKVGSEVQKKFGDKKTPIADSLWGIQKSLSYRDITPKQAVLHLYEAAAIYLDETWKDMLRSLAL